MTDEVRRARPGFISDAEDMLHDFDEIDRLNEGKLTPGKIDSIKRAARYGGTMASPEWLAKNYGVPVEDVIRLLAEIK